MNLNLDLKFYSLTVIDFFEESKSWQAEEFILNCQDHKKELEEISIRRKNNRYYGCRLEIGHLIDFLRKLLWFNLSGIYPAGMRRDDYELMINIFKRYTHPTYINKVEAEALPRVLSDKNRSPHFPDIEYKNEFGRLNDSIDIFSKSVRAMMSLLNDRDIVSADLYDNLKTDDDIENKIFGMVLSEDYEDKLQDIFHLIQTWGGITGRQIYIRGNGFNWDEILPKYKNMVDECLKVDKVNKDTISNLCQVVKEINASIKYLGISFITKHVRFWLYRNLKQNALPIYDSIMAKTVMNKQSVQIWNLEEYWLQMYYKSLELKIDLMPLERQIFKYAFDRR